MTDLADAARYKAVIGADFPEGKPSGAYFSAASDLVRLACKNDTWVVEAADTGLPINGPAREAMGKATALQVAAMLDAGVSPFDTDATIAADGEVAGAGLGSASYSKSVTGSTAVGDAKLAVLRRLTPPAVRALKLAGLNSAYVSAF